MKSENRNRMGTETLHGRVREAASTGFPLEVKVSRNAVLVKELLPVRRSG